MSLKKLTKCKELRKGADQANHLILRFYNLFFINYTEHATDIFGMHLVNLLADVCQLS